MQNYLVPGVILLVGAVAATLIFTDSTPSTPPLTPTVSDGSVPAVTAEDHILGNPDARLKIVEYSDLDCPACQQFHPILERVVKEYPEDVAWVWRHFPLTSIHPSAAIKAEAAECAADLGGDDAFWGYVHSLVERAPTTLDDLPEIAQELELDMTAWQSCYDNRTHRDTVRQEAVDAAAAGGTGTPFNAFILDGQQVTFAGGQPFEVLAPMIDTMLETGELPSL